MGKSSNKKNKIHRKPGYKLLLALTCLLFSSLLIINSTYSWFTSEDKVANHFEGLHLKAEITEEFSPEFEWQPASDVKKIVRVQNTGQVPAFVRVSLYEYFLSFKVDVTDQTGNGNLLTVSAPIAPEVDEKNIETWKPAADAGGTYSYESNHFVAAQAIIPNKTTGLDMYHYQDTQRESSPLKWLTLNFPSNVYTVKPAASETNYWLYKDGYFYYSELLQPGEVSEPVLNSLTLSASTPNKYKGALYRLVPVMDAHDATLPLLDSWEVGTSGDLYEMYEGRLSH